MSTSRKVTVIQVTSNLNSETAITIRIDPSESIADISGRRRIDRKKRFSPVQVSAASARWKSLVLGREQRAERNEMNERRDAKTDALGTVEGGKRREAAGGAG